MKIWLAAMVCTHVGIHIFIFWENVVFTAPTERKVISDTSFSLDRNWYYILWLEIGLKLIFDMKSDIAAMRPIFKTSASPPRH